MFDHIVIPKPSDLGINVMYAAFEAAMAAPSPQEATPALIAILGKAFHAKRAYIYRLLPGASEFTCTCEWCADGIHPMSEVTHGLTMGMAARWFSDGIPQSLLAIRDLEKFAKTAPEYATLLAVRSTKTQVLGKLMRGNHPMGTLGFDDPDPELFDTLCSAMYPICAFATSTLNTQNLLNRIRSVGMVDRLTGAGTRMSFYAHAEKLPPENPIGMAYLDVCGLQGVNDVRGHDAGDELLIGIRQVLITEFADDQVFRMGGDEFLVIAQDMPETPFRSAMERIKQRLSEFSVYIAMGVSWQQHLGADYDTLVRHTWLACTNDKLQWERAGGERLDEGNYEDGSQTEGARSHRTQDTHLDIAGCYQSEEFFHRASVWTRHTSAKRIAVIAIDINYFKLYNDIFGRDAGDLLLESYAKGITHAAKKTHGVPGYLGGDNFAMVFAVADDQDEDYIRTMLSFEVGTYEVSEGFAPSMGVLLTSEFNMGFSILYDRALVALQAVKGSYTEHISFYDESRYERERENQMLLIRAQEGLAKGEFTFFLQPKVDITTNKVVSAEALVRWISNGEVISPYRFIGPMENSGYIFALDRYIWEKVCAWQRSLIDRGIAPVPISVNVSRVDFHFADLADHFCALVKRYDLDPRLVGIEVTESAYSKDSVRINDVIRRMQDYGFLILMDDFGSGYSSLNMLRDVAVDVLKMDKGFIDHAEIKDGSDAIISNVIKMAHMMGLPVISEGVETETQRDSLRKMDCDYVQGYFYYRPMDIASFEAILQQGEAVEVNHYDNFIISTRAMKLDNST